MRKHTYILFIAMVTLLMGCIKNDIPYPRIHANITAISAAGQSSPANIDSVDRVVTLYFHEDANIYNVKIDSYSLTPDARIVQGDLDKDIDLSSPYTVVLAIYQDYEWTIKASQQIDRYFTVEGQVGTSIIDADARTVTAYVSKKADLEAIKVTSCKLAPTSATVTPDIDGATVDFTSPVDITTDNYGHVDHWTVNVEYSDAAVVTVRADAWTCVAWVYGEAEADKHNTFEYRIKGDTEWITVPDAWVSSNGGSYNARITGLTPQTTYEARAISGTDSGESLEFTTGSIIQMPNSNFDQWWLDGKVWDPWAEGGTPYWDTGNKGAATLGQSNSVPTDDTVTGSGQAAMLQTKFVGVGFIGKLAAGNIFVGSYVRTDGTNGILSFGREFNQRPTKLTGYLKYKSAPISSVTAGFEDLKGRPDTCSVWIALIDTDEPFEIRTNPNNRQLFNPDDDFVIAYGKFESGDDIPEYMQFEITLDYKATDRVPRYILVAASASKLGDYFTGGNGSILYVDDFELKYDY